MEEVVTSLYNNLTFDHAVVTLTLTFNILSGLYLRDRKVLEVDA